MESCGSRRFPLLAAVCGIALVVLLAVSPVADAHHCGCPRDECDFYCSRPNCNKIPFIKLFKNGDHTYPCDLMHRIGGQTLKVKVANSVKCTLAIPKKSHNPRHYLEEPCHHTLYTNGDDVASRTFNWGPVGNGKFLKNCIKIYIGSAQYMDGSNYHAKRHHCKSCVMVETDCAFRY